MEDRTTKTRHKDPEKVRAGRAGKNAASAEAIALRRKEADALELRTAGATLDAIARQLGYDDHTGVSRAIKRALERITREPAEELREIELQRLDRMLVAIWPQVVKGDVQAIDRALKIGRQRAQITGIFAPVKIDLNKVVAETAASMGLTPDEAQALHLELESFLAAQRHAQEAT
jgi:hypothetical protein